MSEAEQARGPQRNEARGAGSAGKGEDSAGDERMSGTADGGAPGADDTADGTDAGSASGAGAVTDAQDTGRDAGDARGEAGTGRGGGSAAGGTPARDEAPSAAAPSDGTPAEGASGKGASKGSASAEGVASGKGAPAEGASGKAVPEKAASGRAVREKAAPATEERLLAGRYRLGTVLGRGGMGTVWRAVDETLGRTVAVKELRFPNAIDEDEKRRLITRTLREAKAIARIRNNSAVTVFDVVDEDDRPWIVMELVEGKSLAEVVREDGVLTPRRAAEVGLAILDVLRSAHREGILHRDVKPSNVLIGKDGRVVLTDFGIAQVEGDPSITSTGMLVGAPSYISPERARGHKPGPAADLWSLGGLLYASVEGTPPYDKGSAIATLTAVMTEPLDPPKNAGPLEEVIYGLLAKDPAQRLDDAGARAMLTRVVNAPAEPEPEPSPEQTRVIMLPPAPPSPPAAPARPVATPKDPAAADRVRGALRSVRNAAAAAKAENRSPSRTTASRAEAAEPGRRPATARASLTDVVPRRTLVIIAVVAALAVLSTVLVIAMSGDGEKNAGDNGKGAGDTTSSAGATQGGDPAATGGTGTGASPDSGQPGQDGGADDGQEPGQDGGGGDGADDGASSGDDDGAGAGSGQATLPEGYVMVSNDRWHFTMAMPSGFRLTGVAGQNSGGKFSVDGGVPRVQVDFNSSPKDDAAAAWAAAVAAVSATSNGYKHIGIRKTEYNGYPTVADWEFQRKERGQVVRVLNRGFKVDARRGYSIMITCKADEWDGEECETLRRTAFATFSPKD